MPQGPGIGYATIVDPTSSRTVEMDTITCAHCQRLVFLHDTTGRRKRAEDVNAGKHDPGGFCRCCKSNICGPCADKGTCTPFMKKIEAIEARARLMCAIGVLP